MTTTTASRALPWALIGAACLGSFAATSSGTTRAPFLLEMSDDLGVSMPLVANLVSITATAWGFTSAFGGWLSDRVGRGGLLVGGLFCLALAMATIIIGLDKEGTQRWLWIGGLLMATLGAGALLALFLRHAGGSLDMKPGWTRR